MAYQFGEAFERVGIRGMGHQGASWCALNTSGVLTLMGHQNYVHKRNSKWIYEMPFREQLPQLSPSGKRSFQVIREYFSVDKPVIVLVAEFVTDGYLREDGSWEQSVFRAATGSAYHGALTQFDIDHAHLVCTLSSKFEY